MAATRQIELVEYKTCELDRDDLQVSEAEAIWRDFRDQVDVEFPTVKTDERWALTSRGYVGQIPLSEELVLRLSPKVPLGNLFRMLEVAHRTKFQILPGMVAADSLDEFYDRLAGILARRILDRARKGYHRAYLARDDRLLTVRGGLDLVRRLRRPWEVRLPCLYQEHTADLEDNQILAWTLRRIARTGALSERTAPFVRRAYRSLQGLVSLRPFRPNDCTGRLYNRLNHDYEPMHALCRFFLETTGPTLEGGDRRMLPFLIDMAGLFEAFVARWLEAHVPPPYQVRIQENVRISEQGRLDFRIDIVLYDTEAHEPVAVIDTKYKAPEKATAGDVHQIVAYATSKGCRRGVLVYPVEIRYGMDDRVGEVRVQTLTFPLEGDLNVAGQALLALLLR